MCIWSNLQNILDLKTFEFFSSTTLKSLNLKYHLTHKVLETLNHTSINFKFYNSKSSYLQVKKGIQTKNIKI